MNELKPCPFCGGKVSRYIGPLKTVMIICETCGADVCFYGAEHEPKATKAWNRRAEVEAEPVKHGRWEFETAWQYKPCDGRGLERKAIFGTTKRTFNRLKCSGCKKVVVVDDTIHYAYCPHCGAKMEGEEA